MAKKTMGPIEERYRDGEVTVEQWSERDRSFIGIQEVDTGEYLAEWWDEDVLQMFEDGFFEPRRLEMSVIEYADEVGIPAYFGPKAKNPNGKETWGIVYEPTLSRVYGYYYPAGAFGKRFLAYTCIVPQTEYKRAIKRLTSDPAAFNHFRDYCARIAGFYAKWSVEGPKLERPYSGLEYHQMFREKKDANKVAKLLASRGPRNKEWTVMHEGKPVASYRP